MGRYAYFSTSRETTDQRFEYKFWFGIQDSEIPWAKEYISYYVPEYDEDEANKDEMTEHQREIWKQWAEEEVYEPDDLSDEQKEVIESVGFENYNAEGEADDDELQLHELEVKILAKKLGVEVFKVDTEIHESWQDSYDAYNEYLWTKMNEAVPEKPPAFVAQENPNPTPEENKAFVERFKKYAIDRQLQKQYADLALKTLVLHYLKTFGNYYCHYEC